MAHDRVVCQVQDSSPRVPLGCYENKWEADLFAWNLWLMISGVCMCTGIPVATYIYRVRSWTEFSLSLSHSFPLF